MKWNIKLRRKARKKFNFTTGNDDNGSNLIMPEGVHLHIPRKSKIKRDEGFPLTRKQTFTQKANETTNKILTEKHKLLDSFIEDGSCYFLLSSTPVTTHTSSIITTSSVSSLTPTLDSLTPTLNSFNTIDYNNQTNNDHTYTTITRYPETSIVDSTGIDSTTLTYSVPFHSYGSYAGNTYTSIHIPKEHSESSGVASVASSDLSDDIIVTPRQDLLNFTQVNAKNSHFHRTEEDVTSERHTNRTFSDASVQKDFDIQSSLSEEKSTQTDFNFGCTCSCKNTQNNMYSPQADIYLDSSPEVDRRDSGISSISCESRTPSSPHSVEISLQSINENEILSNETPVAFHLNELHSHQTPNTSSKNPDANNNFDSVDVIIQSKGYNLKKQYNEEKERLITQIKKTTFDPKKELYLIEVKKNLLKDRLKSFDKTEPKLWNPISSYPTKGVLKRPRINNNYDDFSPKINIPATVTAKPLNLKTKDVLEIISQVRQCLDIVKRHSRTNEQKIILQKQYKIHRKIRLKSYKPTNEETNILQNENTDILQNDDTNCFPCSRKSKKENKEYLQNPTTTIGQLHARAENSTTTTGQLHACAEIGDIRSMLELMQTEQMDINEVDDHGVPAIHYAFKHNHIRTAILLMEAGTNIKEYTQQRIKEYKNVINMIQNNNIEINT